MMSCCMAKIARSKTALACRYSLAALASLMLNSAALAKDPGCRHLCQSERQAMTLGTRPIRSMDNDLLYLSAEMARNTSMSHAERLANHYWLHESEFNEFGRSRGFTQWLRQGYHVFWRHDTHLPAHPFYSDDDGFESRLIKTRFGDCKLRYSDQGFMLNLRGYF